MGNRRQTSDTAVMLNPSLGALDIQEQTLAAPVYLDVYHFQRVTQILVDPLRLLMPYLGKGKSSPFLTVAQQQPACFIASEYCTHKHPVWLPRNTE